MLVLRKSNERGHADFGWLKAKYSFSFANYYDPKYSGFGDLLVINEDQIQGGKGFDRHPHKDMEIITYVVEGALEHKDSMGNEGIVSPGEIQYMSAGTGVFHSEYNHLPDQVLKLLQIWIIPDCHGHRSNYGQHSYMHRLIKNELCLIVSGQGRDNSIKINQDALIFTARLEVNHQILYQFTQNRKGWIQLIKGDLIVNGIEVESGDGLSISNTAQLQIEARADAEFLFFDLR